ncbi:MAG: NAD-dependent epimerase/dehydratase family protein [Gammaproteobacteria bacterium]
MTGANGFIGLHCLAPLSACGFEVHAVASGRRETNAADVAWHTADLLKPGAIEALLDGLRPSHLLHLAWFVVPGAVISAPENYAWVGRSLELLRAFSTAGGVRAVFSGSVYEYDWRFGYCSEELTPRAPTTVYGACKSALFEMATAMAREAGVSMAWARPFFLYGPYEYPDRIVAAVTRALLQGEPARTSHGRQVRDYLYVQDVADAIVAILDSDLSGAVNVGSGVPVTLAEIVTRIGQLIGRHKLLELGAIPARANDAPLVVADPTRLTSEIGWQPRFDLTSGLEQTIGWWHDRLVAEGRLP